MLKMNLEECLFRLLISSLLTIYYLAKANCLIRKGFLISKKEAVKRLRDSRCFTFHSLFPNYLIISNLV